MRAIEKYFKETVFKRDYTPRSPWYYVAEFSCLDISIPPIFHRSCQSSTLADNARDRVNHDLKLLGNFSDSAYILTIRELNTLNKFLKQVKK
jgi:hypothetical protein